MTNGDGEQPGGRGEEAEEVDLAVTSIELEDEDGNPVRIAQQNAGPGNQVGQGEFKPVTGPKDPGTAAAEQRAVDEDPSPERANRGA